MPRAVAAGTEMLLEGVPGGDITDRTHAPIVPAAPLAWDLEAEEEAGGRGAVAGGAAADGADSSQITGART
jgi:hypothetical protein